MTTGTSEDSNNVFVASAMEAAIKIGVLVLIVIWCFQIVRPFITLVVWGEGKAHGGSRSLRPSQGSAGHD